MLIDLTLAITPQMTTDAMASEKKELAGHLGTHFDVMNKEFPLEYTERHGVAFDVSEVEGRDIDVGDIDIDAVQKDMFVAFYTGFIDKESYGTQAYFSHHPQLSDALINTLVDREIAIIGVDFAGIRRGAQHTPKDQYCADRGVFVVENLCCLNKILENGGRFIAHTYPMTFTELTGLPCRVIAEVN